MRKKPEKILIKSKLPLLENMKFKGIQGISLVLIPMPKKMIFSSILLKKPKMITRRMRDWEKKRLKNMKKV